MPTDDAAGYQPVVLVGGRSTRFGRDKLREPWPRGQERTWLVDRPIAALRAVCGARVWVVGDCDAAVAARGDRHVADRFPGIGPLGGIVTAMEEARSDVVVLSGDLPEVSAEVVRTLVLAAGRHGDACMIATSDGRVEPLVAVYRAGVIGAMREAIARGEYAVRGVLERVSWVGVEVDARLVRNVNRVEEMEQGREERDAR
jgi:molybdopterin-guanine dinucleotide biosynthesis protein A